MSFNPSDVLNLASPTALSILGSAGPIPEMVVAGSAVAVTAAVFFYKRFKNYEEKKHKEKIDRIIKLYQEHLEHIFLTGYNLTLPGLPKIFQFNEKENNYDSLHYTLEQVKALGMDPQENEDVDLDGYTESIQSAINKLKDYYYKRYQEDSDDVTVHVLSYLLNILQTKCYNFQGYELDIAYLTAIMRFIDEYCSDKTEHSQHFSRLKEVYSNLAEAKAKLETHQQMLSLSTIIIGFKNHCKNAFKNLIRLFVKMFAKADDVALIGTANANELKDGLLRKKYIKTQVGGIVLKHDEQIDLPNSIFKTWTQKLVSYYLSVVNFKTNLTLNEKSLYQEFISFVEAAEDYIRNKPQHPAQKGSKIAEFFHEDAYSKELASYRKKHKTIVDHLKQLGVVFKDSNNYVCSKFNVSAGHYEPVETEEEIVYTLKIMANFAKTMDVYLSLQELSAQFSKSIKKLGELYFETPEHFHKIFTSLEELCALVHFELERNEKDFKLLAEQNQYQMQIAQYDAFHLEIENTLQGLAIKLDEFKVEVVKCRKKAYDRINKDTISSTTHDLFEVVNKLLERYKLPIPKGEQPEPTEEAEPEVHSVEHVDVSVQTTTEAEEEDPVLVIHEEEAGTPPPQHTEPVVEAGKANIEPLVADGFDPKVELVDLNGGGPVIDDKAVENEVSAPTPKSTASTPKPPLAILAEAMNEIEQQLNVLKDDKEGRYYTRMFSTLKNMTTKAVQLRDEKDKSIERQQKADKIQELTLTLAQKTAAFMNTGAEERHSLAKIIVFNKDMELLLNNRENSQVIDLHYNPVSRYIYTHICSFGIFRTETRKKLANFSDACQQLSVNN